MRRCPFILPFVCTPAGQAQETASAEGSVRAITAEDLRAFLAPFMTNQLARRKIAGAVLVVVKDDTVLFDGAYGLAEVAAGRAMTTATPMRIGSVTKLMTALAAMQLVEAGILDLDRDVGPELGLKIPGADGRPPVTLRRLLTHRTQFEDRGDGIASRAGAPLSLLPFIQRHMPPRLRQNDDLVAYSNPNATMVAALVERASGKRYDEYVAERIFARVATSWPLL